jgi:tetratricopeptide (TPR) repeat protein
MKKIGFVLLLTLFIGSARAQINMDSLWLVWNNPKAPVEEKLKAIDEIAWVGYLFTNPDSAFVCAQMMYDYAELNNRKDFQAQALNTQAISFYLRGDYQNSIVYHDKCLTTYVELKDKKGQAKSHNNIGAVYGDQGNQNLALEHYFKSLDIAEEIGDNMSMAGSMANIGIIYFGQQDYDKALEYYQKSLLIQQKQGNKQGVSIGYNNIGTVYAATNNSAKAIEYFEKSLKMSEKIGDLHAVATSYDLIGQNYFKANDLVSSMDYFNKALEIRKTIGDKKGAISTLVNIGRIYQVQKKPDLSKKLVHEAMDLAKEIGVNQELMASSRVLYELYKSDNDYKKALEMFELYVEMSDSIRNEESEKKIIQQQFKYDFDKKITADSVKNAEKDKVNDALREKQEAQIEAQENKQIALFLGLGLISLFSIFIVNRLLVIRKQKDIIEHQKELVEDKNKEISDSINYAKRIQDAILPSRDILNKELKDGFVLFKPKDVVSGDFYWLETTTPLANTKEDEMRVVYLAAADCTGHGVPGAMISVICSNALSKVVLEERVSSTGELLDKARNIIIDRLAKNNKEVKDGMDISLASLRKSKNAETGAAHFEMQWSGANNPLWIVRSSNKDLLSYKKEGFEAITPDFIDDNGFRLFEIKPDKQPVAIYDKMTPFTSYNITIQEDDRIYLFTDGYADQFGGAFGKKMKSNYFKSQVLAMQHLNMDEQKQFLDNCFEEWRAQSSHSTSEAAYYQLDDVCVIGVRVI